MWSMYPQSKELPITADSQWNIAISDCIVLLEKHYKISYAIDELGWKKVDIIYQCSKMENFIQEYDISH